MMQTVCGKMTACRSRMPSWSVHQQTVPGRMLRLTDIQLPLDHPEDAIRQAILDLLGIGADRLVGYTIFRRSFDARKKAAILLIYALDVEVRDEDNILHRLRGN